MWPLLLDMSKEECVQNLRNLELEAYSSLVSALRAQGPLNQDKRRLLKETSVALNITNDRHKAEVRRAISDERLNTIAYHLTGQAETLEDWAQEGRRMVPLLPRVPPQTAYSVTADEVSEAVSQINKQLPVPANTERKRPIVPHVPQPVSPEVSKPLTFRVPEPPRDDSKKRKLPVCSEGSSLAQHLLGPKLSRIQQIYRQSSKPPKLKQKESAKNPELDQSDLVHPNSVHHQIMQPTIQPQLKNTPIHNGPKINVIQNISLQTPIEDAYLPLEKPLEHIQQMVPVSSNENQAPKSKTINVKPTCNIAIKQPSVQTPGPSSDVPKTVKTVPSKKSLSKGQKLIVVSNAQTIPSNSILQKTLSVPMNKVTKLNLEKFKIVSNNSLPSTIQVTTVMNSQNVTSAKHKVVTLKTNPGKKVIPLSQLQMLNSKGGIKVLPLSGKIVGKNVTVSTTSPLYVTKSANTQALTYNKIPETNVATSFDSMNVESDGTVGNGKSAATRDFAKEPEDFESKINEFQISQVSCNELECIKQEESQDLRRCDNSEQSCTGNIKIEAETEADENKRIESIECIEPESKDFGVAAAMEVENFQNILCEDIKPDIFFLDSSKIGDIIKPN